MEQISAADLLNLFPYGIGTLSSEGALTRLNGAGRALLGDRVEGFERRRVTCCDLFACGTPEGFEAGCLTELALEAGDPLPEVRLDLPAGSTGEAAVWVTAAPLSIGDTRTVVLHLRPGHPHDRRSRTNPHWAGTRRLNIVSLGRTQVRSAEGPLEGRWLTQRAGQLLKYLIAERGRVVFADEIAEALWPGREQGVLNNVRYFIHELRDKLEPDREKRIPSSFVLSEAGGYRLNLELVEIDANVFEAKVRAARAAAADGRTDESKTLLEESVALYGGDFLADEPYAPWTLNERERLRALAAEALRTLTNMETEQGDSAKAMRHLEQLAALYPFDSDVEHRLIELALRLGANTYARRRYAAFRMRMLREFGHPPEFELANLVRAISEEPAREALSPPA